MGRDLLRRLPPPEEHLPLMVARAYEGNEIRPLAKEIGFGALVPPNKHRRHLSSSNERLCRRCYQLERLLRRLKACHSSFLRFDKLDMMFTGFIHFALIAEA